MVKWISKVEFGFLNFLITKDLVSRPGQILRHFDYKTLLMKPSKSQLAEIERLDKLYIETQLRFAQWF